MEYSITINQTKVATELFDVEADKKTGDIVLMSVKRDVVIEGGYSALREEAIEHHGRVEQGFDGDELEYEEADVQRYVEQRIQDYIQQHFAEGKVTIHDND